jgi:hypothetical protein
VVGVIAHTVRSDDKALARKARSGETIDLAEHCTIEPIRPAGLAELAVRMGCGNAEVCFRLGR